MNWNAVDAQIRRDFWESRCLEIDTVWEQKRKRDGRKVDLSHGSQSLGWWFMCALENDI